MKNLHPLPHCFRVMRDVKIVEIDFVEGLRMCYLSIKEEILWT